MTNLSFSFFVIPLSLNQFFKTNKVTTVIHFVVDRKSNCHFEKGLCTDSLTGQPGSMNLYRFSAFWLRSKCSICSYQLNIWYGLHSRSRILNWFLTDWNHGWACSPDSAGCHGIALPPCSSLFRKRSHLLYPKCYLHNAVNLLLWQKTVQMITKQHFIPNFLTSKIIKNNVISSKKVWDDCDCIFFVKKHQNQHSIKGYLKKS